jgi:hypothetical protein
METIPIVERAISHHRERGKFLVRYNDSAEHFDNILPAFIFYFDLEQEATLWDITEDEELLEKKICH